MLDYHETLWRPQFLTGVPAMEKCDLLLRGGVVIDGSGQPRHKADVAVRNGVIIAVGDLHQFGAGEVVDVSGLVVAPGFIDVHTHDDRLLLADPLMQPKVSQGVTTVITGNCGISLSPLGNHNPVPPLNLVADPLVHRFETFASYFGALDASPPAVNVASLIGHTTLRVVCMNDVGRAARPDEIAAMQALVREALEAGALGLSTGMYYAPAQAATSEEVREVCEPLRGTNALIASHLRNEGDDVLVAMTEAMTIANDLGVRQVLSHHKVMGSANFGRSTETLALVERARKQGDVCLDCYPYTAASTVLRQDAVEQASRTLITWSDSAPEASGRYVDELLRERGGELTALLQSLQPAGAIYFIMDEADVERILAYPETMVGSDGLPHDTFPHPRLWGAFPRVLGHYTRDRKLFPLETAVHKMTGLSASRFGLADRGLVRPGFGADLVVFDPERVADRATFKDPKLSAAGIDRVYVNGTLSWHDGASSGARAGKVLRRASPR